MWISTDRPKIQHDSPKSLITNCLCSFLKPTLFLVRTLSPSLLSICWYWNKFLIQVSFEIRYSSQNIHLMYSVCWNGETPAAFLINLNNPPQIIEYGRNREQSPGVPHLQKHLRRGNVCKSVCEEEAEERGLGRAGSTELPVSTSHKSTRLCRMVNWVYFFPHLFSFLSLRTGFCCCAECTKEPTIITAVIDHYSVSPIRVLVNYRTKSLRNSQRVLVQTVGWFIVPA